MLPLLSTLGVGDAAPPPQSLPAPPLREAARERQPFSPPADAALAHWPLSPFDGADLFLQDAFLPAPAAPLA